MPSPERMVTVGGDENINFSFAADGFAKFRGDNDSKE